MKMEKEYKIHAIYILGLLLAVIVILTTVKWAEIPNLAQYISFGLTFASLLLAVLAIGYAVYSNTSFSQNISSLNNASKDITDSANGISAAAADLAKKMEAIPTKLESMEDKVLQTHILLQQYSERKDEPPPNEEEKKAASELVDRFVKRLSTAGLLLLYACLLSITKDKPFDSKQLFSELVFLEGGYGEGILVTTRAAGLINFTRFKDILSMKFMNEKLKSALRPEVDMHISKMSPEKFQVRLKADLEKIETYFQ
jgi:hypothetical protein